jgi:hypothetical protein
MQQEKLWDDTLDDATGSAVKSAGGVKKVAGKLWPAKDVESAAAKLRACLSPEHEQKLSLSEWLMIGKLSRESGDNCLMEFLGRELTNEVKPLAPVEARKRVKRARRLALIKELERLEEDD